jgi:nucleoside 2-deoxyribosyltransferase
MKVVYVAGPFRAASAHVPGHQDMFAVQENIMRAMALSLEVWRLGAVALCPHANTMFFTGAADDRVWLDGDLELLRRSDAVLLTADWQRSSGARHEVTVARAAGIPVCETLDALRAFLGAAEAAERAA